MRKRAEAHSWARGEFGDAELGDARHTSRLVEMARGALLRPGGRVSEVYGASAERQGAYKLLESSAVRASAVKAAAAGATLGRCAGERVVFVAIDGTSLTLADRARRRELGHVGTVTAGARGLKMLTGYAVSADGTPLGMIAQQTWARVTPVAKRRYRNIRRKTSEKETQRWLDVATEAGEALASAGVRSWYLLDREGDAAPVLTHLAESGHLFTVRASANRRLDDGSRAYLRDRLAAAPRLGTYPLTVAATATRAARQTTMTLRSAAVRLRFRNKWTKSVRTLALHAVWAREEAPPEGVEPLDWLLLTNAVVSSRGPALDVVRGYALRWRIEEVHRTWKSGACCVEDSGLRSKEALEKWSTILLAVATRIEHLKLAARATPDAPAGSALSAAEIEALVFLKTKEKKRTETIVGSPTIGQAVRWIADLGGYNGPASSGGPPGSITIARGFERVLMMADAFDALRAAGRLK